MGAKLSNFSNDTRRVSFSNDYATTSTTPERSLRERKLEIDDVSQLTEEDTEEIDIFSNHKTQIGIAGAGDAYWTNRLSNLQNEHEHINQTIKSEYEKSIENTKKLFSKPNYVGDLLSQKSLKLQEVREKVLKCYQNNPGQPLACSNIVQAFNSCVKASQFGDMDSDVFIKQNCVGESLEGGELTENEASKE